MAKNEMNGFKVVAIGGSAGSLETILAIVQGLPKSPGAAIIIIVHRKNDLESILANLLSFKTHLVVKEVEDKDPIYPDHIYIAPPDYHLLIEDEHSFSLDSSEKVQFSRPSIDVAFESVAEVFAGRAIGILLSGANSDGAKGLLKIRESGGYTIVQNPATADMGYMPQQAINLGAAQHVLDADALVATLNGLF
ncbi:MAG TPA: chemotaxis protein CheB [Saprospiraceae bacterium]|nr:chemotaxis protein CheB [Saprospiraceae bacterium]HPI04957.1 chemotaxis protein CheB [Saprospiraceae bacterium]